MSNNTFASAEIVSYIDNHTQSEPILLQNLIQETYDIMPSPQMLCGRVIGRLLKLLVSLSYSKAILEIGMFTGYSALSMAEALPENGRLVTCDIDPKAQMIAEKYFKQSSHGKKIAIKMGPALETLKNIDFSPDFVFIDADKGNYLNYYQAVLPKLKVGGLIVLDNALRGGRVISPNSRETRIIDETNKFILADESVENVLLPIRDGLNVVRKK